MTPDLVLIDADILLYEIGFPFEDTDDWEPVALSVDKLVSSIIDNTGATRWELYLTGRDNFRKKVATTHVYKGNRKQPKPKWYQDIKDYLVVEWGATVVDGVEADDMLAIRATEEPAIIASRDKDLRQVAGWHYGWPCGYQPEFPLQQIDEFGYMKLEKNDSGKKKFSFGGLLGLYAQMITGDKTDNIIGLKGKGDVFAFNALKDCQSESDLISVVQELYEQEFGEDAPSRYTENYQLLRMLRSREEMEERLQHHSSLTVGRL